MSGSAEAPAYSPPLTPEASEAASAAEHEPVAAETPDEGDPTSRRPTTAESDGVKSDRLGAASAPARSYLIHGQKSSQSVTARESRELREGLGEPLTERIQRFAGLHDHALEIADYIDSLDPHGEAAGGRDVTKLAAEMRGCFSRLLFRRFVGGDAEDAEERAKLIGAVTCGRRKMCPCCAQRRSAKLRPEYAARVHELRRRYPDAHVQMLTTTVKNGPDLKERLDLLQGSESRLWRRAKRTDRDASGSSLRGVIAAVRSTEVKRGEGSGLWHPHTHWLVVTSRRLDQAEVSREWAEITGDGSWSVDVRDVTNVEDGVAEVLKYALKFSSMAPADVFYADSVTQNRHLLRTCGEIRGVKEPADLLDEPLPDESGPSIDYLARWVDGERGYRVESVEPVADRKQDVVTRVRPGDGLMRGAFGSIRRKPLRLPWPSRSIASGVPTSYDAPVEEPPRHATADLRQHQRPARPPPAPPGQA